MPERRAIFAVPGDPDTPTGGYGYDRRMASELRAAGWAIDVLRLPDGFPDPTPEALSQACALLRAQPEGVPLLVDGLALGAMPRIGSVLGPRRPLVALVHHPLAMETGLSQARATALRESERRALAAARRVVATSRATAAVLSAEYAVPTALITVVPPGTDPAARAVGSNGSPLRLLSVGTLVRRKGHDVLLDALARLQALSWHLTIVGDATRDPDTADALRAAVRRLGLAQRVALAGAVDWDRLQTHYSGADLFVLASRHEGYGMAFTEALARGLPVVGTRAGAIGEAIPAGAALLVPPDDAAALAATLRALLTDPAARRDLADVAWRAAATLPRWPASAALLAQVLQAAS